MFPFMEYKNTYKFFYHNLSYESPQIFGPAHLDFITVLQEIHMCKIVFLSLQYFCIILSFQTT